MNFNIDMPGPFTSALLGIIVIIAMLVIYLLPLIIIYEGFKDKDWFIVIIGVITLIVAAGLTIDIMWEY